MIISCIGDSLTEGDYGIKGKSGIADVRKENYPYFLQQILKAEVRNFGKCGYAATSYLKCYKSGVVDVTDSDYIIVMLGTNGGTSWKNKDCSGNKDYAELISLLKKDAPNAEILLSTPPHATTDINMSNCGYASQAEDAGRFVFEFAKSNSYYLIDMSLCKEFCAENESIMQPNDGLHFSEIGYKTMARFIANHINKWRKK